MSKKRLQMQKNPVVDQLKHQNAELLKENKRIREALIEYRSKYEALVNTLGQEIPARYAHFPRRKRERYGLQKVA